MVRLGPELRRGLTEANGQGEVVGGIVIARFGENARAVIDGVKQKLDELKSGLPPGVIITTAYDRSDLIDRAMDNLTHNLIEEMHRRGPGLRPLPAPLPQFPGGHRHPAPGGPDLPGHHVRCRHQRQHHEPGGHRPRHRGHGGRRGRS